MKLLKKTEIRIAIEAIQSWLLGAEVQFPDGPHRGGIVGWMEEDGVPAFLYPEIAGYYLSWLAFFASVSGQDDEAAHRANLVLAWIDRLLSERVTLPTRIYLQSGQPEDWRNRGSFLFDLSMLARGLASVWHLADANKRMRVQERLVEQIIRFCRDPDILDAFHPCENGVCPPPRWSCAEGPYQTKAAAAILMANEVTPVPDRLSHVASAVYSKWRMHSHSSNDLHAMYYHLEGLIIAAANGWDPDAMSLVEKAAMKNLLSDVPETMHPTRSDVVAQALRIASIICDRCHQRYPAINLATHLAGLLQTFMTGEGAVLFCQSPSIRHRNVWCSIFAHQAFCYFEAFSEGLPLDNHWLQFLV